jgi:hypothetical protein
VSAAAHHPATISATITRAIPFSKGWHVMAQLSDKTGWHQNSADPIGATVVKCSPLCQLDDVVGRRLRRAERRQRLARDLVGEVEN